MIPSFHQHGQWPNVTRSLIASDTTPTDFPVEALEVNLTYMAGSNDTNMPGQSSPKPRTVSHPQQLGS